MMEELSELGEMILHVFDIIQQEGTCILTKQMHIVLHRTVQLYDKKVGLNLSNIYITGAYKMVRKNFLAWCSSGSRFLHHQV